jgi:hypothetical protein
MVHGGQIRIVALEPFLHLLRSLVEDRIPGDILPAYAMHPTTQKGYSPKFRKAAVRSL